MRVSHASSSDIHSCFGYLNDIYIIICVKKRQEQIRILDFVETGLRVVYFFREINQLQIIMSLLFVIF